MKRQKKAAIVSDYKTAEPQREVRATCPRCGNVKAKVVLTKPRTIGSVRRTDRWHECDCGQRFRSYTIDGSKGA
jgi:DNA-directed RNA polymerase subunit M/transcription elongation factor TFIIS